MTYRPIVDIIIAEVITMARQPRLLSGTGMYHVMFRGINKQEIFHHDADYKKLKEILLRVKKESSMQIYAYCMMPNHVHLFLREENPGDISTIMKKILFRIRLTSLLGDLFLGMSHQSGRRNRVPAG